MTSDVIISLFKIITSRRICPINNKPKYHNVQVNVKQYLIYHQQI